MAKRKYARDKDGKFASVGAEHAAKKAIKRAKRRKLKKAVGKAKDAVSNSKGQKKLTVAGGKSVSIFVGGSKRALGKLPQKKAKAKKKKSRKKKK